MRKQLQKRRKKKAICSCVGGCDSLSIAAIGSLLSPTAKSPLKTNFQHHYWQREVKHGPKWDCDAFFLLCGGLIHTIHIKNIMEGVYIEWVSYMGRHYVCVQIIPSAKRKVRVSVCELREWLKKLLAPLWLGLACKTTSAHQWSWIISGRTNNKVQ